MSSFSVAFVTTSGLTSSDLIVIDASVGDIGTQFASTSYQVDNETTQVGCAVFSPVTISNLGQTVSVPVPDDCSAAPGDEMVVQIFGGVTNPDTSGPVTMQVWTTTDPSPVTTNELQLDPTVPFVPTNVTATPGDQSVRLDWTSPDHSGGDPITAYNVYCSETSPPSTAGTPSATTDENGWSSVGSRTAWRSTAS